MTNGDRASPWHIPHLMETCAVGLKLVSSVVPHIPIEFLMKALRVLLILDNCRHSKIHVYGNVSWSSVGAPVF